LNASYLLPDAEKLTQISFALPRRRTERLLKQGEAAFPCDAAAQSLNSTTSPPAAWLIRNSNVLDCKGTAVTKTVERASKIFQTYNLLLN
jgi:hypothetical protein